MRGTRIAYLELGTGEPVVALHCSGAAGAQWRRLAERLAPRFRLLAPDLHGHGESDPWPGIGPMKLADESRIVSRLMARVHEPVHLLGHSYGGAVALSAALAHAGRLRSLTREFLRQIRQEPERLALARHDARIGASDTAALRRRPAASGRSTPNVAYAAFHANNVRTHHSVRRPRPCPPPRCRPPLATATPTRCSPAPCSQPARPSG